MNLSEAGRVDLPVPVAQYTDDYLDVYGGIRACYLGRVFLAESGDAIPVAPNGTETEVHTTIDRVPDLVRCGWIVLSDEIDSRLAEIHPELRKTIPQSTLPDELRELTDGDPTIMQAIVDLNDHCGWTFDQIADWLESIGY